MTTRSCLLLSVLILIPPARAERFRLLTGVDARHYPGTGREVPPVPGPGFPGEFFDGDRLAGTSDVSSDEVPFYGTGTPLFAPNEFGALSMLLRRGSVPVMGDSKLPLQGIEFLGGPLLDLDGDLTDGQRSLIPVEGQEPVIIPDTDSYFDLAFDPAAGTVTLKFLDVTGNNEGGPSIPAGTATILVTLAGTSATGEPGDPINPLVDTRTGTLTAFGGSGGTLAGVWRITDLGYEFWEDSIDAGTSTAGVLGSMQFLGRLRGWLVFRDAAAGQFPKLAGQGLGTTLWPEVDTSALGQKYQTAQGLFGGSATITAGPPQDQFDAAGNGGLALTDFGGDLGAYLDAVVVPRVPAAADRLVYLESAGFGINNSFDPIFLDTISYDAVLIAAADSCEGFLRCDVNCDGTINAFDIDPFVLALTDQAAYESMYPDCSYLCSADTNGDGKVDAFDIDPFVECLLER